MTDPELSRQIGELQGTQRAIERSIGEMAATNTREHAEVVRQLEGIRVELKGKADDTRVDNHSERIRTVEGQLKEVTGGARLIRAGQGALVLALTLAGYLVGKGGP